MGDMVVYSLGEGTRIRIFLAAEDVMVSRQERLVHARELFSRSQRGSYDRNHRSVLVGDRLQPFAVDPELTEGQPGIKDGQEDGLVARLLLCWSSCP